MYLLLLLLLPKLKLALSILATSSSLTGGHLKKENLENIFGKELATLVIVDLGDAFSFTQLGLKLSANIGKLLLASLQSRSFA